VIRVTSCPFVVLVPGGGVSIFELRFSPAAFHGKPWLDALRCLSLAGVTAPRRGFSHRHLQLEGGRAEGDGGGVSGKLAIQLHGGLWLGGDGELP
jgi:hypothetical protein